MAKIELINESGLDFIDISSELTRTYHYTTTKQTIDSPAYLNVNAGGGHRILDESGESHYIPKGWERVSWTTTEGKPHFTDKKKSI